MTYCYNYKVLLSQYLTFKTVNIIIKCDDSLQKLMIWSTMEKLNSFVSEIEAKRY